MENLRQALRVISEADAEDLQDLADDPSFLAAKKSLSRKSISQPNKVRNIVQSLAASVPDITQFICKEATTAVSTPSWTTDDFRFADICQFTGQSTGSQQKFRVILAYRSLAQEFSKWDSGNGRSRVAAIANNISQANNKHGNVAKFIKARGYPELAKAAVYRGIKLLVLETLNESAGISVLLVFAPNHVLRTFTYSLLDDMVMSLRNECVDTRLGELKGIMPRMQSFIERCQRVYDTGITLGSSAATETNSPRAITGTNSTQAPPQLHNQMANQYVISNRSCHNGPELQEQDHDAMLIGLHPNTVPMGTILRDVPYQDTSYSNLTGGAVLRSVPYQDMSYYNPTWS